MRAYDDLTEQGKIRRLHTVASEALAAFDIDVVRVRCIARHTNTTFRVDAADGDRFVLRVGTRPDDTELDPAAELAWLEALSDDPTIDAVRPLRTRSGDRFVRVAQDGVYGPRVCILFGWLPGRPIGEKAGPEDYRRLGGLAARLHDHGERWRMPSGIEPLVWDRVFYYPTEPVVLYGDQFRHHLTPERTRVVRAVEEKAAKELARIHRECPISVLHGDLHPWNVHTWRGSLFVFDFEDVMVGNPVQDIATTLFYNRDHPEYDSLCAAFEAGYREQREWPVEWDGQLELLMAARTVMFINYVLRMDLDPDDHIPRMTKRIERVL